MKEDALLSGLSIKVDEYLIALSKLKISTRQVRVLFLNAYIHKIFPNLKK